MSTDKDEKMKDITLCLLPTNNVHVSFCGDDWLVKKCIPSAGSQTVLSTRLGALQEGKIVLLVYMQNVILTVGIILISKSS